MISAAAAPTDRSIRYVSTKPVWTSSCWRRGAHLHFVGGFPDHCLRGQKVDIRILELERPALPPRLRPPGLPRSLSQLCRPTPSLRHPSRGRRSIARPFPVPGPGWRCEGGAPGMGSDAGGRRYLCRGHPSRGINKKIDGQ